MLKIAFETKPTGGSRACGETPEGLSTTSPPLSYLHSSARREPFNLEFTKSVVDFDSFAFFVLDYLMSV